VYSMVTVWPLTGDGPEPSETVVLVTAMLIAEVEKAREAVANREVCGRRVRSANIWRFEKEKKWKRIGDGELLKGTQRQFRPFVT
jgi:hypothetical protein